MAYIPMDIDPATAKFEQALPFALLPVSTQLAAFHSSRTAQSPPQSSCSKCGSLFALRKTRVSRSKHTRALLTTCSACGANSSRLIESGDPICFPPYRKASRTLKLKDQLTSPQKIQSPSVPTQPLPQSTSNPAPTLPSNSKSKKKSSLQEMLQRNREKEQQRTKSEQTKPSGLSAFLSTL